ncbi:MAG TPA: hypothetical protein VHA33_26710 [Candidatus Angelobacter sp.]|jgi:adenosylhomocysteine nucleosidase|nr:hypothetical protein [Candidatus Angelobacter sp.]
MTTIAIIAALDRELKPLVKSWKQTEVEFQGKTFRVFQGQSKERKNLVAVAGGIGSRAAKRVASAMVAAYRPTALISAGVAGAIVGSLKIGCIVTPYAVINVKSRNEYRCRLGEGLIAEGVVVSADEIADQKLKQKLGEDFHALAVDMEAAAVAEIAKSSGIDFGCVKAISDETNFPMLPLNRFVSAQGDFLSGRFAAWTILRPWTWTRAIALGRNSNQATQALCNWLKEHV